MIRLIIAALFAGLMGSAMAADEGNGAQGIIVAQLTEAPAEKGSIVTLEPVAPAASAVPSAVPAAAPATAAPATAAQPSGDAETRAPEAKVVVPKSSIPLEKRKGGDITQCLEAGSKSDKDIAACAEKYRH